MARVITATATLPRIIQFVDFLDYGPMDPDSGESPAHCPHCGSGGRYIHTFVCEDGVKRGAMSGCVQLFPVAPIAHEDMKLRERVRELQKKYGPQVKLTSWDTNARAAIDAFYAGTMTEHTALALVRGNAKAKADYYKAKRSGRR